MDFFERILDGLSRAQGSHSLWIPVSVSLGVFLFSIFVEGALNAERLRSDDTRRLSLYRVSRQGTQLSLVGLGIATEVALTRFSQSNMLVIILIPVFMFLLIGTAILQHVFRYTSEEQPPSGPFHVKNAFGVVLPDFLGGVSVWAAIAVGFALK